MKYTDPWLLQLAEQPAATTAAAARSVPARKRGGGAGGRSGVEEVVTLERIRHLKGEVVNLTRKFMSGEIIHIFLMLQSNRSELKKCLKNT